MAAIIVLGSEDAGPPIDRAESPLTDMILTAADLDEEWAQDGDARYDDYSHILSVRFTGPGEAFPSVSLHINTDRQEAVDPVYASFHARSQVVRDGENTVIENATVGSGADPAYVWYLRHQMPGVPMMEIHFSKGNIEVTMFVRFSSSDDATVSNIVELAKAQAEKIS